LIALATAQLAVAFVLSVRGPKGGMEGAVELCGDNARLRIAWIGAEPKCGGGVAGCAWLIMKGLTERGCMVDWYASGPYEELADRVAGLRSVRLISYDTGWRFSRWYSKHRVTKVFSGFSNRARARRRLGSLLLQQHRHRPYDVIYQFSTIEIFGIRRQVQRLPPLVVHPETHIAGELRWVRRERPLAARCEPLWRRMAIELFLMGRARRQRHDIRLAARVAAISDVFGRYLVDDYGLDPSRLFRIPNPIDTDELRVHHNRSGHPPWRIAFVGRMSVRKGVDLIIELSHRLADLEGDVSLELVGADTLWSDYRPLLVDLNENIAIYHGQMSRHQLIEFLQGVDLLVQPAKYEPFGLTVGEALALGVPVVASTEVGAVEGISPECCAVFESGNANELERVVRAQLHRLRNGDGPSMSVSARVEAERRFAPEKIADLALSMLSTLAPQGAAS
jgi:glycosyltransferase involved in cell wall biosynthesis